MSTNNTEDEGQVVKPVGPGIQLRAAREAQGLELGLVAAQLHLDGAVLRALEADDYDKLPGAVFIQGYLRNYGRLLGVPVEPLLDAFQQNSDADTPPTKLNFSKVKQEVRSSHAAVRMMTWIIVLGLIALVVVWWRGYLQWPLQTGANSADPVTGMLSDQPASMTEEEMFPDMPALKPMMEEAMTEPPLSEEMEAAAGDETDGAMASPEEVEPLVIEQAPMAEVLTAAEVVESEVQVEAEVDTAAPETVMEVPEAPEAETVSSATGTQVVVIFKDASWIDIKDAEQQHRIIGTKPAGTRLTLEGNPPYNFKIGNAAGVEISVNGAPYDLAAHIRGNVARFNLNP